MCQCPVTSWLCGLPSYGVPSKAHALASLTLLLTPSAQGSQDPTLNACLVQNSPAGCLPLTPLGNVGNTMIYIFGGHKESHQARSSVLGVQLPVAAATPVFPLECPEPGLSPGDTETPHLSGFTEYRLWGMAPGKKEVKTSDLGDGRVPQGSREYGLQKAPSLPAVAEQISRWSQEGLESIKVSNVGSDVIVTGFHTQSWSHSDKIERRHSLNDIKTSSLYRMTICEI